MPPRPLVPPTWRPAALITVAVATLVVAALSVLLYRSSTTEFDTTVGRNLLAHVGAGLRPVLLGFAAPALSITVLAGIAVVAALARRFEVAVLAVVGPSLALAITEVVLKPLIHRRLVGYPIGYAFPSGHETGLTSMLIVVALLLTRVQLRRGTRAGFLALLGLWALAGAIGLVTNFYHYVSDTVGGAGVSLAVVLAVALLIDRVTARSRVRETAGSGIS